MANETRPRRESSSTSRIRKAAPLSGGPAPASTVADDNGLTAPVSNTSSPEPAESTGISNDYRDRIEREPYPQERPADREPIRYVREREPGLPVRERLRDRSEREAGGTTRERDGAPLSRERARDHDLAGARRPRARTA
jgi:transcription termination factor Rho